MNIPELETDRLIIRRFTEEDVEAILRIFSNEKVNEYLPWHPLKSIEEAKDFYEQRYANTKEYKWAICLKSDNVPIGYININNKASHDFGYGLLDEYWRQGIVSEAGRAVVKYIRDEQIYPYITATHDIKNPHSGYVMQTLGMKYHYTYEELWEPKNIIVHFRMYQLNFYGSDYVFMKYWDQMPIHYVETDI